MFFFLFIFRLDPIVIVIVISRFIKRYLKAKSNRVQAYSRALRLIKEGFSKRGQEKLRSNFQNTGRVSVKGGVICHAPSPHPLLHSAIPYCFSRRP